MSSEYFAKTKKVIEEKTGVSPGDIHEGSFFEDDLNIGEMELLEILSELEEMYRVDLVSEQENIATVQDIIDLLSEKID
ncbi:MAG: acyl carrier protein [candidate division WWE3 bacterium GW2011_GWF2_41_45]|uniref:Carrier domain-containing protein n=2 Tax=Katanobacteria TaxID=422282 RepID=A0A1F4W288_UNCKA|nr:MAG: acyl carrier protein [candidate division WWE3 bacterium GW2011_GWC2_41_23]KKS10542.1 MAG: acyl carrier protein [candidate division WWE3 bacterium GW2011_GWF2_41_45]KKS20263.1 MAG: acyl carrier protein [candidate division WWE3 bacterium GW2011_GWE1_41_72]KKS28266.1 MAG: acyl carrier protein [candidate division WWE3 bacterium GW2011_GWC1_42_102]KKS30265.1 MAG: acyl carrier protein [candidate division WWE3 bacterium GW2011_GWD2_42_11]KKS51019.1 MAG: acyl carrier protein [candidate divisio